MHNILNSKR